jgi:hypothetical protein
MSGWMKYPHQKCCDCPIFEENEYRNNDEIDDVVNEPSEICALENTESCIGVEDEYEN